MKRYVIEMLNDYGKKYSENHIVQEAIEKMRNGYICGIVTSDEVIRALCEIINK